MMCVALSRSIGGVPVDVVIEEKHTSEMEIAQHPVEKGAKISDHAWRTPFEIRITGAVGSDAALASYQSLLDLQEKAEPFDFVSPLKLYSSMLVRRIEATRDAEKARILHFEAELQEVIIVSTQSEAASETGAGDKNGAAATADKAKKTVNRGQIQPLPSSATLFDNAQAAN
jgi:hypothetical protein